MKTSSRTQLTSAQCALVVLMHQYLSIGMEIAVTLAEAHSLMYFLQAAGENLDLRYKKELYGPYAPNLGSWLTQIDDSFLLYSLEEKSIIENPLHLQPGALEQAKKLLLENEDTSSRCTLIAELFEGFETAYGMELLATVHWVATKEEATTPKLAVDSFYAWNDRKKTFAAYDIKFTWQHLKKISWLS